MVAESLKPGASVAMVAQRYGVNANLLFTWRRQEAAARGDLMGMIQAGDAAGVGHGDRRTATDGNRSYVDLSLGGHWLILRCPATVARPRGNVSRRGGRCRC